ncbi:unnamed protein product [Brassica rapa]|uniref:Uncharacterized protein n=1 Tax=Brassica campestris TaxID=3711 RepID=A0A3P5ZZD8_BRACM|nr:unnamed protein product [Brassica rapa]VDC77851.1 unnamed protein product [Brassica rapa]
MASHGGNMCHDTQVRTLRAYGYNKLITPTERHMLP